MVLCMVQCGGMRPNVGPLWKQKWLFEGPPNSPPKFKQGWQEGCESGISAFSNNLQRYFYKFKQDSELTQDKEYYIGWKIGWEYCKRYAYHALDTEVIAGEAGDGLEALWPSVTTDMHRPKMWGDGGDLNIWGSGVK